MAIPRGKRAGSKTPTVDYDAGWIVRSTSTKCATKEIQDIIVTSFPFFFRVEYVLQNRGGLESTSVEHQQFGIAVGGGAVP